MGPKGKAAFQLTIDNSFDNSKRSQNVEFLNISFEPIGQDFSHGTGRKMHKP